MNEQNPPLPPPSQGLESFSRFRRALRRSDQILLDDLFAVAQVHVAAAAAMKTGAPSEVLLISMLLEEHKEVRRLRMKVEKLLSEQDIDF